MSKRMSVEDFIKNLPPEIKLHEETFKGNKSKATFTYLPTGQIFEKEARDVTAGQLPKNIRPQKAWNKISEQEMNQRLEPIGFKIIGNYKDSKTKCDFIDKNGNKFSEVPEWLLRKGRSRIHVIEEAIKSLKAKMPEGFELIEESYVNHNTPVKIKNLKNGKIYEKLPSNVRPNMVGDHQDSLKIRIKNHEISLEEFKEMLKNEGHSDVEVIDNTYVNRSTKCSFLDKQINKVWDAKPGNVLNGGRHPHRNQNVLPNGLNVNKYKKQFPKTISNSTIRKIYENSGPLAAQKAIEKGTEYTDSSLEIITAEKLKESGFNFVRHDKGVPELKGICRSRPDFKVFGTQNHIYLNSDGLFMHSDGTLKGEDLNKHFRYRKSFEDNGIILLQFRQDEIYNKWDAISHTIKRNLKSNQTYKDISTANIQICDNKDIEGFLAMRSLRTPTGDKSLLMLLDKEIVACISYTIKNNNLEISVLESDIDVSLKDAYGIFIDYILKNSKDVILNVKYLANLRYELFLGDLYDKTEISNEFLDFVLTDGRLVFNKDAFESDNASIPKLYKIYDAGQRLYVKKIK